MQIEKNPIDPDWLVQVCSVRLGPELEQQGFKLKFTQTHTFTHYTTFH